METLANNNALKKAKDDTADDVHNIKEDIQGLLKRLKTLKDESKAALFEDSKQLVSTLVEMKDNLLDKGNDQLEELSKLVKNNPLKSMVYTFISGMVFSMLLRK